MATVTRISVILCTARINNETTGQPTGIAMLPYQNATSYQISRLVAKCDFKNIHVPVKKISSTFRPPKDNLALKTDQCVLYTE